MVANSINDKFKSWWDKDLLSRESGSPGDESFCDKCHFPSNVRSWVEVKSSLPTGDQKKQTLTNIANIFRPWGLKHLLLTISLDQAHAPQPWLHVGITGEALRTADAWIPAQEVQMYLGWSEPGRGSRPSAPGDSHRPELRIPWMEHYVPKTPGNLDIAFLDKHILSSLFSMAQIFQAAERRFLGFGGGI